MKHKKIKLSTLFLLGLGLTNVHSQETTTTTGGDASGSGGSASYTVGQVVYTTDTGTNGTVAKGVQQPYEISIVSGLKEITGISLVCTAHPNPTNDVLILNVTSLVKNNLIYKLYDVNGKLLESNQITTIETSVTMFPFAAGTYILKIYDNSKEIKSFKIIKAI